MSQFDGVIDTPVEGAPLPGVVAVTGWTVSHTAPTTAATISVDDQPLGTLHVGLPRADVAPLFAQPWAASSGYAGIIDLGWARPGVLPLTATFTDADGRTLQLRRSITIDEHRDAPRRQSGFDAALLRWLSTPAVVASAGPALTRGAYQLRAIDTVARDFVDVRGNGRIPYLVWLLDRWRVRGDDSVPAAVVAAAWRSSERVHVALPERWRDSGWGRAVACWLNDDAGSPSADDPLVSWFSLVVHAAADARVQRSFPTPLGEDRSRWAQWVCENAVQIYGDEVEDFVAPIRATLPAEPQVRRPRAAMGLLARRHRSSAPIDVVSLIDQPSIVDDPAQHGRLRAVWPKRYLRHGVNLVGHYSDNSGAAEATRATARAVRASGWSYSTLDVGPRDAAVDATEWLGHSHGSPYAVTVLHDNIAGTGPLFRRLGARYLLERTTVAFWYWEMNDVPPAHRPRLQQVDEVWVASRFTADAFRRYAGVPVHVVPPSVDAELDASVARGRFRLPEDEFLFLCMASVHSEVARKNPDGVVEAFSRAFDRKELEGVGLVLKVNGLALRPDLEARLLDAASRLPLHLVTDSLSRQETLGLISCCDALVSLHRGEGFGLPIAEAMALGRPVVVTAYSGNMDFTDETTAFLVDHDLVTLAEQHGPYEAGMTWAEPRLDSAAEQLRRVRFDAPLAARRAAAGQARIRTNYGLEAASAAVAERLADLSARP